MKTRTIATIATMTFLVAVAGLNLTGVAADAGILNIPGLDPHNIPGLDPHNIPGLDPHNIPGLDPHNIPGLDPHNIPGLDPH